MVRHGLDPDSRETLNQVSRGFRHSSTGATVDRVVADGDALVAGGRPFRVHERPGHSPTDTVFHDVATGLLIGGDHMLERISSNPIAHAPIDDRDPVAVAAAADRPRPLVVYLDSRRATAALDVGTSLPGQASRSPATGSWSRGARRCTRAACGGSCARSMAGARPRT
jgi:glyoxylase-like metal-dependent hydrolase (beta-lactamase superfamily II)